MFERRSGARSSTASARTNCARCSPASPSFWGIFMLIILLGAGAGLRNGFEYNFKNTATTASRSGCETSKPWNGLPANRDIQLTEKTSKPAVCHSRRAAHQRKLSRMARRSQFSTARTMAASASTACSPRAETGKTDHPRRPLHQRRGRRSSRKVLVIAEDARKELFKDEDPLPNG